MKTDQEKGKKTGGKEDKAGPGELSGLGALFRNEREKRRLTHEQVARVTRLRRHFLEALENEEWGSLPPSVFVKGFIKSYAKTLGLDERKAIELYESVAPAEPSPPKPLIEPKKSRKRFLFLLLLIFLGAVAVYLWGGYKLPGSPFFKVKKEVHVKKRTHPVKRVTPPVRKNEKPKTETVKKGDVSHDIPEPVQKTEEMEPPAVVVGEDKPDEPLADNDLYTGTTVTPDLYSGWLILQAAVRQRTWINISIDGGTPKEYIFQSGSNPQWKAKKGFNILIGNAAGIEFDFNGEKIKDIGSVGEVVRLRLPENFEQTDQGD